jgi:hypothetical protein
VNQLQRLEEEAVFLLRETAALFRNPVMLYSIGKDSTVLAHLAAKAFWPAKPPFPLLQRLLRAMEAICLIGRACAFARLPYRSSSCPGRFASFGTLD